LNFKSHEWDSDIDSLDFDGQTGEVNRNLLRQYKTLLLAGKATKEFIDLLNPVIWKEQVVLLVGAASSRDHFISRLEAAPTGGRGLFMVIRTFQINAFPNLQTGLRFEKINRIDRDIQQFGNF